jgi:ABC-2 type transport system ATP-binding protein
MTKAVAIHNLTKRYPWVNPSNRRDFHFSMKPQGRGSNRAGYPMGRIVLDQVSFQVEEAEIFGIIGSHGAGKSTLIQILAALVQPDEGEVRIFGVDIIQQPAQAQRLINRVSREASFFKRLSPIENLMQNMKTGSGKHEARRRVEDVLQRLGIDIRVVYSPMESLTRDEQQKVSVARALLSCPRVLLLDEPTRGLDATARNEIRSMISELRDLHGVTVLLASREPQEFGDLCERAVILSAGQAQAFEHGCLEDHKLDGSFQIRLEEVYSFR